MLRSYFYKLLRSPLFYLGFLATLALCLYNLKGLTSNSNVLTNLDYLIGFESYRKMFVFFSSLPFASNFADEWNSKTIVNCVTRKHAEDYTFSNIVICYFSSFAVVFLGIMVYVLISSTYIPLYDARYAFPPYGILCENGLPMLANTLIVFVYASSCGMWTVMGLAASAFFPSKYIAICAPFVFCYIIERFTEFLPGEFQLAPLSKSWSGMGPLPAFLKANAVFLLISVVCGVIFTVKVKRRIENELS